MQKYQDLLASHSEDLKQFTQSSKLISRARLIMGLLAIYSLYRWIRSENDLLAAVGVVCIATFAILLRKHRQVQWKQRLSQTLVTINKNEIDFLDNRELHYYDGVEYIDQQHLYSYDLDLFGPYSLYHHINRCSTYAGKKSLAKLLLSILGKQDILANQGAIKELAPCVEWRQETQSLGLIVDDTKDNYDTLQTWTSKEVTTISPLVHVLSYLMPLLFVGLIAYAILTQSLLFGYLGVLVFLINILILASQIKGIRAELLGSEKVADIFKKYGLIFESIEKQSFQSSKLKNLQDRIKIDGATASDQLSRLAMIFSNLQSVENLAGAALFNGAFLYHIHALRKLQDWKKQYAPHIIDWIDVIAEIESLGSIANMYYNNPDFTLPTINDNHMIQMDNAGHPLLAADTRVTNHVDFSQQPFIILTGSNMSGKSTFLRTLGINMVLAGIGSPICATHASIHPLPVIVSMRQTDSLADGESYFFAEIKRLQLLFNQFRNKTCFVLLDELLKGTNSDDKRSGTLATIRNVISAQAFGALATHDLEVCKITDEYPDALTNKCFEVEIKEDDLHFDYKLRDGICQNQSATFLMKKLGLI